MTVSTTKGYPMAVAKKTVETKKAKTTKSKESTKSVIKKADIEVTTEVIETAEVAPVGTAKAGKRSSKALAEKEAEAAKAERKAKSAETTAPDAEIRKTAHKPARPKIERRGKKFQEAAKLVETGKMYTLKEAIDLALKTSPTKFDATVELHINLGVDPTQADQNVRDTLVLPSGSGKAVRVAVYAEPSDVELAKKAGAEIAGGDEILKDIEKGIIKFDTLISTSAMMTKLGKLARVLGPKGLMPNPKSGTVTNDVAKAVTQAKAGRVEYRVDSTGIVHLGAGKVSFGAEKLMANVQAVFASVKSNKPASIKGLYVKRVTLTTTMGPAIKVAPSEI